MGTAKKIDLPLNGNIAWAECECNYAKSYRKDKTG